MHGEPIQERQKFIPRTYPEKDGDKGNPYIQPNGLGRYFVARQEMQNGKIKTVFAKDPDGELEAEATHLARTRYWGADDDGAWYPVTPAIAEKAIFGQRTPRWEMSAETVLVHIEANQREYAEQVRAYDRGYTIDDYPELDEEQEGTEQNRIS